MQQRKITEGINLYMLPDDKFKNAVQGIFFHLPLQKETATTYALIPKLLTAGSEQYPDKQAFNMALENMYGARLWGFTDKIGETQIVGFLGDVIADQYGNEPLTRHMFSMLEEILLHPLTENNGFAGKIFEREKIALLEEIESVINDKRRYALLRLVEEMCKEEPYGIRAGGLRADLDGISPETAYHAYLKMLQNARVDIVVAGAFSETEILKAAEELGEKLGARTLEPIPCTRKNAPEKAQYIEDKEPVTQGKLVLGYRADIDPLSDAYYALTVYNGIFGGGTSSKLFREVREKMSLCYYASSGIERMKGLLFVQSGIEFSKYQVAVDAIFHEASEIANGNITEAELTGAKNGIQNHLRSYKDSPASMVQYALQQLVAGKYIDIDTMLSKIDAVSAEDVRAVAQNIKLDTVYFLGGEEEKNETLSCN